MVSGNGSMNRRGFLKGAAAVAVPAALPVSSAGAAPPSICHKSRMCYRAPVRIRAGGPTGIPTAAG